MIARAPCICTPICLPALCTTSSPCPVHLLEDETRYLLSIWHLQVHEAKLTHLICTPTRNPVMGGQHGARFIVSPHQHILQVLHLFNDTLNAHYCHDC